MTKFAVYVARILLCESCKFGEKNYYSNWDHEFFLMDCFLLAHPVYFACVNFLFFFKWRQIISGSTGPFSRPLHQMIGICSNMTKLDLFLIPQGTLPCMATNPSQKRRFLQTNLLCCATITKRIAIQCWPDLRRIVGYTRLYACLIANSHRPMQCESTIRSSRVWQCILRLSSGQKKITGGKTCSPVGKFAEWAKKVTFSFFELLHTFSRTLTGKGFPIVL